MTLRVELLGGVRATVDDVVVDLGGRRPRAVLAALAILAGRAVSVDRLIDLVWEDEAPSSARRTVQSYVSGLRTALGGVDAPLSAAGAGYVLTVERRFIDLLSFEDSVERARAIEEPTAALAELSRALSGWAQPLDGIQPSLGLQALVAPFEELRIEALEASIDLQLERGDAGRAVGELEALVRQHPLRERFWAQLVQGLDTLGRRDAALHACQRAREALREALGVPPSPLLVRLECELLDGGSALVRPVAPAAALGGQRMSDLRLGTVVSLPRPVTELVGRVGELERLVAGVTHRRLVTVTGTGGVGKTRLAIEIAWKAVDEFPGGVRFVDLAAVIDVAAVEAAVASMLSIPTQADMSVVESIVDWLRGRRVLMVLDNCEHVLAAVVELVGAIVSACPTVAVLATSREPLGVPGERVHHLSPLDPATCAVELFCDRAADADDSFAPTRSDRAVIVQICRRLDGIPLALELAAARIRFLTPNDLLDHLVDRFRLVHATGRGLPGRQQTLLATVVWSYERIADRERLLFDRVSVFVGGFDLAAAEAVCAGEGLVLDEVVDILGSLVDKSMVVADRDSDTVRFHVLETLRQFGVERLEERGATTRMMDRHRDYFAALAARASDVWASPRQLESDAIFDREWDNLRAAHGWAVTAMDLAAADALVAATGAHAWCRLSHEHGEWATKTLSLDTPDDHRSPTTYGWAAYWAFISSDYDRAIALARAGIAFAPSPGHPDSAWCWAGLTWTALAAGQGRDARLPARRAQAAARSNPDVFFEAMTRIAVIEEAFRADIATAAMHVSQFVTWTSRIGAPSLQSRAAFYLGNVRARVGNDYDSALSAYGEGLELARTAGDLNNEGKNLVGGASAAARLRIPEAATICRDALARLYDTRHWPMVWAVIETAARWMAVTGNTTGAAVVYGHLDAHQPSWDLNAARPPRAEGLRMVDRCPGRDRLMDRGAAMERAELIAFVLDQLDRTAHESPSKDLRGDSLKLVR